MTQLLAKPTLSLRFFGGVVGVVVDAELPIEGESTNPVIDIPEVGNVEPASNSLPPRKSPWSAFIARFSGKNLDPLVLSDELHQSLSTSEKRPNGKLALTRRILTALETDRSTIDAKTINKIVNSTDENGLSLLHKAARISGASDIITRLIQLGADPFHRAEIPSEELKTYKRVIRNTAFIQALCYGEFENALAISRLVEQPFLTLSSKDEFLIAAGVGDSIAAVASQGNWKKLTQIVIDLHEINESINPTITAHAVNWLTVESNLNALHFALIDGAPSNLSLALFDLGARISTNGNRPDSKQYEIYNDERQLVRIGERELVTEISNITSTSIYRQSAHAKIREEAKSLFCKFHNPQHLYYYLDLFNDACLTVPPGLCESGAKLVGHLQYAYQPQDYKVLISEVEKYLDEHHSKKGIEGAHPFFREMALLLWHPEHALYSTDTGPAQIGHITKAITAQKRWLEAELPLKWKTVFNWMRLGKLTHDFIALKWETVRLKSWQDGKIIHEEHALIEDFCAERIAPRLNDYYLPEDGKKATPNLGIGYLIKGYNCPHSCRLPDVYGGLSTRSMDPRTIIELRQSYLRIYHPSAGTLFITNSSPDFGRDRFREPFYFAPLNSEINWGPRAQLDFSLDDLEFYCHPIDSLEINGPNFKTDAQVDFLINQFLVFRDANRLWKFNNDPQRYWDRTKLRNEDKLVGGHRSPGFKRIVTFLDRISTGSHAFNSGEALIDLAFCDPKLPPRYPHKFVNDHSQSSSRLPVTPKVLTALKNLTSARNSNEEYEEDLAIGGLRNFFERGLELGSHAELFLLDHRKERFYNKEEDSD